MKSPADMVSFISFTSIKRHFPRRRTSSSWLCLGLVFLTPALARSDDWPQFRGPHGTGVTQGRPPMRWSAEDHIKWRVEMPGPGNGSPIVSNGRVFLSWAGDKGVVRGLSCYDRGTGKELWSRSVEFGKVMPTHQTNPYAASTPVADGTRVVVWHGSAGLYCYDFKGERLWSRDLGEFRHMWGYGASPIIHDEKVILHCGPGKRVFMTALDLKTGKTLWETDEPVNGDGEKNEQGQYVGSWSTPVIVEQGGRTLAVCGMMTRINAYDTASGRIVWSCDGLKGRKGELAYTSPLIADGKCVLIGGFNGPGLGLKLGGEGNVSETHRLWRVEPNPQSIGSGVYVDGYLYLPDAGPAGIRCLDPMTGKVLWQERRRRSFWGSIVAVAGRLYVTDQGGETVVFEPNPEKYVELAANPLGENSNSTPAIAGDEIFVRTMKALYCIAN